MPDSYVVVFRMFEERFGEGPFIFRLNDSGGGPPLLAQVSYNYYCDANRCTIMYNHKKCNLI